MSEPTRDDSKATRVVIGEGRVRGWVGIGPTGGPTVTIDVLPPGESVWETTILYFTDEAIAIEVLDLLHKGVVDVFAHEQKGGMPN